MSSSPVNLEKYRIPLEEINRATNHFSLETQVGAGGFGMVYKGQLSEHWGNRSVAIKRLNPKGLQGNEEYTYTNNKQFNNELKMVSVFKHPNIIPFIGFCDDEDEKIVVYELATNGSLEHHIQDPSKRRCLTWEQRLKICLGAARGIKYIHSGIKEYKRVIHRDLKTGNILLNDNMEAKICDFGLSRLISRDQPNTYVHTNACGTNFYLDPVYNERKRLSKESDIYSFGVVMFEMSSGVMAYYQRRFEDVEEKYLLDLVRSYYDDHELVGGLDKLIDSDIKGEIDMSSFHIFNEIAHECIHMESKKRPTMDRIIERIEEALTIQISFQVNKESRKKNYMLGAKDLSIEWQDDTRYWKLGHIPESRFPEVYILKKVWWLEIHGEIEIGMLSQKSTYAAYLVFRTTKDCKGLAVPAKTRVSYDGIKMKTENVYLRRPQHVQENYVLPRQRKDGWMEIKLGEFECNEGDDGKVDMVFKENKCQNQKSGLIVEGIEIRPK